MNTDGQQRVQMNAFRRFVLISGPIMFLLGCLAMIVLTVGSLTGFPVPVQIERLGCEATYEKYRMSNDLCQLLTFGHCPSTGLNEHNAEMRITHCLCEKYELAPNEILGAEILSRCSMPKPTCESAIERIKKDICNNEGPDAPECEDHFGEINATDVDFICQNKEEIFYIIYIQ